MHAKDRPAGNLMWIDYEIPSLLDDFPVRGIGIHDIRDSVVYDDDAHVGIIGGSTLKEADDFAAQGIPVEKDDIAGPPSLAMNVIRLSWNVCGDNQRW